MPEPSVPGFSGHPRQDADLHLRFLSDPVALHCTNKKHQAALGMFNSFGVTARRPRLFAPGYRFPGVFTKRLRHTSLLKGMGREEGTERRQRSGVM